MCLNKGAMDCFDRNDSLCPNKDVMDCFDRNEWPLDRMCLQCDVTKKSREDVSSPPREGALLYGLFMEGARWDSQVIGCY